MAGAENAGSIVYEVSADVAPLLQGGRQVNQVLSEIESALDENINQFKRLETNVTATAQSVSAATRSMGNLRGTFGQLGYQVQDVAVQLQMGQNAMMVFAQQGSQIASIFGPGGAVIGAIIAITGAIAGALLPSLFNSKDATQELEVAQKALADTVVKTDSGVSALSEKIQRLAAVSSDAAKAQIAVAMTDAQKAISAAGTVISEQINDLGSWRNSMSAAESQLTTLEGKGVDVSAALKELGGSYAGNISGLNILNNVTNSMAETFGITQTQAVGLVKVFRDLQKEPTAENMQSAAAALSSLSEQTGYANPKLNELTNVVNQNYVSAANATDAINVLKGALDNLTGATEASKQALSGNAEQLNKLVEAAKNEAATVGFSTRQRAKYVAGLLGATDAELKSIDASYDSIEAYENEQKALKEQEKEQKKAASEAEAAAKKTAAAQQQVVNQLDQLSEKYQIAVLEQQGMGREAAILAAQQQIGAAATAQQVQQAGELAGKLYDVAQATKAAKDEEQKRKEASQNFSALRGQVSPVTAADDTFQKQMEQLNQYATLYPQRIAEVEAVRASIEEQYRQKRQAAMWQEWQQQSEINQLAASAIDSLQGGATNAITGLIGGTQSLQEAFANIGTTILSSVVGSLVEMGIQYVKNQLLSQAAAAATLASTAAQATAAAAAWAPAALSASVATLGSAAAVGQASYASSLLAAKGLAIAGARYNGGPVAANSMYRVGENGRPEIFQANNGSQYMIPGDNGRVISNRDIGSSGGGGMVQNIAFTINTTGGIGEAEWAQIESRAVAISKKMALYQISDQANRPNGMIQPRRK
ncbi:phage tail length tape measure family protein [Siccibacter colletis]|uniref:Phage tail length tape measure family protein n=1 Tax=Siccibacter colletis TaxID=1505757 RepID=A0ABY6JBZ2_9ENTR|nr:phage tail length tape measure family protein [Siccibacter colletis]UYU30269.1 phage tail length tape measure family protein [Siccibacter colletis]